MGFLDFLTGKVECPNCGTKGARKSGDSVRCPNHHCSNYDPTLEVQGISPQGSTTASEGGSFSSTRSYRNPQTGELKTRKVSGEENFSPARTVTIQYLNFQKQQKTFTADAATAKRRSNHLFVQVAPTGGRISLSRDRIQNLAEVEAACGERVRGGPGGPTSVEARVLTFHSKRGTTSPLYEKLRAKFPNW